MKLYYSPAACSLAVHIVAREANVPVELIKVDIGTHRLADGTDFYAINPRGYVPVLELDGGERVTEVAAVVQHIADLAPASALIPPAGTLARVRVQSWLTFVSSELHKGFSPLWHKETADSTKQSAIARLSRHFTELEAVFAQQPYLTGDAFTVADAYAYTILSWAPMLRIDMTPYPSIASYLARVTARPSVHEALIAEGLRQKAA